MAEHVLLWHAASFQIVLSHLPLLVELLDLRLHL
jgi:hypothetical protein